MYLNISALCIGVLQSHCQKFYVVGVYILTWQSEVNLWLLNKLSITWSHGCATATLIHKNFA